MRGGLGALLTPGKRVLWVASCGGHLAELKKMADLYPHGSVHSSWVTFDTPQSRSMLYGAKVSYIPHVGTRDGIGTLRTLAAANRILRDTSYDYVVSTGAAVAVSFLPLATIMGAQAIYVESLTRTRGPSATGKILERIPDVQTYTQYAAWSSPRWKYAGSVLDHWEARPRPNHGISRVLVSLGTIHPYRFDRAVDAVVRALPDGCAVTWQLGATFRDDLPGDVHAELGWAEMGRLIRESDVFVSHAGVGSVLQALDNGVVPALAVRSKAHGEHVDDHQRLFAEEMQRRGLSIVLELGKAGPADLNKAAALSSVRPTSTVADAWARQPSFQARVGGGLARTGYRLRGSRRQHSASAWGAE